MTRASEKQRGLATEGSNGIVRRETVKGMAVQADKVAAIRAALGDLNYADIIKQMGPLANRPKDVEITGLFSDMSTLSLSHDGNKFLFSLIVEIAMRVHMYGVSDGPSSWQPRVVPAVAKGKLNGAVKVTSVEPYPGALAGFETVSQVTAA